MKKYIPSVTEKYTPIISGLLFALLATVILAILLISMYEQ